jgi:hypothetical protein
MQIIEANNIFNAEEMHFGLMVYGFYCYHDKILESIVPKNIKWKHEPNEIGPYGVANCFPATEILKTQLEKYKIIYPNLKFIYSNAYYNIDTGVNVWHTDKRENITLQVMCYQSDFDIEDGGSLQIKCYDGIERHYYPKNGDVVIMNHVKETEHKIDKILTDKKRIVINMVMR